jgi:hypothetical protein
LGLALWIGTAAAGEPLAERRGWWGPTQPNDPERTARFFTRDVVGEVIRNWPPFNFNTLPTALPHSDSPAYADILVDPEKNFLECEGGPFALCFYSGPEGPLPCRADPLNPISDCTCIEVPYGVYYVDIYAILDEATYRDTVSVCGPDGGGCASRNAAPVCSVINAGKLFPGADMISVFSTNCAIEEQIGNTPCPVGLYAGCMTAPCYRRPYLEEGTVECSCPTYSGPYQVGQDLDSERDCDLGPYNVWSAAYNVSSSGSGGVGPITPPGSTGGESCTPDSPGADGCPLWPVSSPVGPGDPLCELACQQYSECKRDNAIEIGYTCDATLCTATCNDRGLIGPACDGLGGCAKDAILAVENLAQCSCCATQVCGCEANEQTRLAVYQLNEAQRQAGVTPQCDINGTLCGTPPPTEP